MNDTTPTPIESTQPPVVVAVGSSADGLNVLGPLVEALPAAYPGAVLVVQHLSTHRPSRLAAILSRRTKLAVKEAVDGESLQRGTVYLAPPNLHLTAADGRLHLSDGTRVNYSRPSIDVLFESVARVYGERAIGVILSGASIDGARGLQAIRRAGGKTIVLAPEEAKVSRMPRAAIGHDGIDFIASLDEIAPLLRRLAAAHTTSKPRGGTVMSSVRQKTDPEIHRDVLEELTWDPRVDETDVGVEVDGGVVTLTGTVTSWAKRQAAQEAARRVAGVLDVANDIVVKTPGGPIRTDTEIAQAVRRTLQWDVFVPDQQIGSTVTNGCVTLDGTVDRLIERDDAERAVRNLAGVTAVINTITVREPSELDEKVERAIARALERRAERHARQIRVAVRDGVATLSGTVTSWSERRALLGAVKATRGVVAVKDELWPEP